MHDNWRAAIAIFACDMSAQLPERIDKIADRPLAHSLDAVQPK